MAYFTNRLVQVRDAAFQEPATRLAGAARRAPTKWWSRPG
jgi:hypothetical protein